MTKGELFIFIVYFSILFILLGNAIIEDPYIPPSWYEVIVAPELARTQNNLVMVRVHNQNETASDADFMYAEWEYLDESLLRLNGIRDYKKHWYSVVDNDANTPIQGNGVFVYRVPPLKIWDLSQVKECKSWFEPGCSPKSLVGGKDKEKQCNFFDAECSLTVKVCRKNRYHCDEERIGMPEFAPAGGLQFNYPKDNGPNFDVMAPPSLIPGVAFDVLLLTKTDDVPYRGPVQIEQIYGAPANFPAVVETKGITRFPLVVQTQTDLKFTAGDLVFYATFNPETKSFAAVLHESAFVPSVNIATILPIRDTVPSITVDYFEDRAWIDRRVFASDDVRTGVVLFPTLADTSRPQILYARLSSSQDVLDDDAVTLPVIANASGLSTREQAELAVAKLLQDEGAARAQFYSDLVSQYASDEEMLHNIRDYVLRRQAQNHRSSLSVWVNTAQRKQFVYEDERQRSKKWPYRLLWGWLILGVLVGLGAGIRARRLSHTPAP